MPRRPWLPLALLLAGCSAAAPDEIPADGHTSAKVPPPVDPPGLSRGLAYGPDPAQVLDLYRPEGKAKGVLVAFVHGGAWQSGSRQEYANVAPLLQKEGFAVASIDYRLSPQVRHPAHAEDVAHALAYLRAHAQGYDASRVVVVGHSAGGHIAATIATDPKLLALAQPAGFVGLEGIYDVPDLAKRWPTYPNWFLNKAFGDAGGWPAASPTRAKVLSHAPWLLVHSKGDELVDEGQTDGWADHLRNSGVKVETLKPEGETHFGVVQGLSAPDDAVRKAIERFASGLK